MSEEEAKKWVKDKTNQDKVVRLFFKKYKPNKSKIAIFMAGIPGAGKTEFVENTIKNALPNTTPIEHDELVEYIKGYKPENYYNFRSAGSTLVTRVFTECLKEGYSFIFDGTLSHENGKRNITKCLKKGYEVVVIYIFQDASKAWELTQAREVVKKRAIERSGFVQTCQKINPNLLDIFRTNQELPNFSFWIINKQIKTDISQTSAIIHDRQADQSQKIEKFLLRDYNIK